MEEKKKKRRPHGGSESDILVVTSLLMRRRVEHEGCKQDLGLVSGTHRRIGSSYTQPTYSVKTVG